ncbi:hypothetical protein [Paraburkholderia terrae]|uniref:hypothetical protein n=1 Tax=Paraburkholderia terrae TaxID=311230 RepID=UPI002069A746|nr:hypothetical protein [Paraburkholderia terrae]BDC37780.1 hypothetical protein PTKU15_10770 [Paraburkholderia terrae]
MSTSEHSAVTDPKDATISLGSFLMDHAPGNVQAVELKIGKQFLENGKMHGYLVLPVLTLHCPSDHCGDARQFGPTVDVSLPREFKSEIDRFLTYVCRNCRSSFKTFAVAFGSVQDEVSYASKYGERPAFGPPLPKRLTKLAGDQRDLLEKGRRSENQGLGIAAFAYYRRVVEEQKSRILEDIIRVSQALGASQDLITELRAAQEERRFTQAIEGIKHGLPQALLINGHNPLLLLHNALSEGLHAGTDEECLDLATSIRMVMVELAERIANALKDDRELNKAVGRLLQLKQKQ